MLGFSLLDWLTYALAALEGAALWGVLLYVAARRRGAVRWLAGALFLVLLPLCLGGQKYFFDQYSAYMNVDVSVFATNFTESIAGQLLADSGNFLQTLAWLTLASLVVLVPTIYLLRPRQTGARRAARLLPIVLLGAFFLPTSFRDLQAATPDVLYLHAMGGVINLRTATGGGKTSRRSERRSPAIHSVESPRPGRKGRDGSPCRPRPAGTAGLTFQCEYLKSAETRDDARV